jgi:hypothetical protein
MNITLYEVHNMTTQKKNPILKWARVLWRNDSFLYKVGCMQNELEHFVMSENEEVFKDQRKAC